MKIRWNWRKLLSGTAIFITTALVVPLIPVNQYREPIRTALEKALGRTVEADELRFGLLPRPGFELYNVTIGEDPSIGAEPVAYVNSLRAFPKITWLFGGALEFASVDLEDASLNLTRLDRGAKGVQWNFSSLMRPSLLTTFPSVHIRSGRINFKFNQTKSLFYLLDTDVDLWPPSSTQRPWTLRIHGNPARTDRPARGFGSFAARGQWFQRENAITLDVKLEKSELGDMLALFNGHESGIQGNISGDAHLAGPLSHAGLSGRVTIANVHGWSQTPPGGNAWPVAVEGIIDAPGQMIDIGARLAGTQSPIGLRYRVADYLRVPRWGVTVNLNRFRLTQVAEVARNLGWPIPADFKFDGTADGAVGYSIPAGLPRMDGQLSLRKATLKVAGAPPLAIPGADVRFSGTTVILAPTEIMNDSGESATLKGSWDAGSQQLSASLSSDGMAIASLRRQVSIAGIPLLGAATAGIWNGSLQYSNDAEPTEHEGWTGRIHLEDTDIPFEAFANPVHIATADATIDGAKLSVKNVKLSAGNIEAQGEYAYDPSAVRPHKFRISTARVNASAIEKLLMPALHRGNFFTYAFNFGRVPQPDWLRNMHAEGTVQAKFLNIVGNEFTNLRSRVLWDGMSVEFADMQSQCAGAAFSGAATVHLTGREPVYEVEGKIAGIPWRSGQLDAEGTLTASGTGAGLLSNVRAHGSFEGREIDLDTLGTWDSATGMFDLALLSRTPQLRLSQLVMREGEETYQGTAETQDDGQLVLRLNDGSRYVQTVAAFLRSDGLKPANQ